MKNIDLFIGAYPGGVQFCDMSRTENGDYKNLAFVRRYGQINYETRRESIPADIIERIEAEARRLREKFEEDTRRDWNIDRNRTYYRLLDYVPYDDFRKITAEKDDERKLSMIFEAYERPYSYETTV